MRPAEQLQVGAMVLTLVVLVTGVWFTDAVRPPPGAEDAGFQGVFVTFVTYAAVVCAGGLVSILSVLKYRRRATPSRADQVEVGAGGAVLASILATPGFVLAHGPVGTVLGVLPLQTIAALYLVVASRTAGRVVERRRRGCALR